jgi:hypothetical protein
MVSDHKGIRAKQNMITHFGNRPVTEITVSHLRGAVQHCHRNCTAIAGAIDEKLNCTAIALQD